MSKLVHNPKKQDEDADEPPSDFPEATPEGEVPSASVPSRKRRAVFVFGSGGLALTSMAAAPYMGGDSILAAKLIDGGYSYLSTLAVIYLSTTSIDRSDILNKVGDMFNRNRGD